MRTTNIGTREQIPVRVLLREMRRTLREYGRLPLIEWNDARLGRAWEALAIHLARNAKVSQKKSNLFVGVSE